MMALRTNSVIFAIMVNACVFVKSAAKRSRCFRSNSLIIKTVLCRFTILRIELILKYQIILVFLSLLKK
jgi:hypothetical protein